MNRLPVYCQLSFLTSFLLNRPKHDDDELFDSDELKTWKLFSELIYRNSIVYIDVADENIKNSPYTKRLLNAHSENRITLKHFKMEQLNDNFFQNVNPHSIFLFSDNKLCENYQDDYGMLFISDKDIYDSPIRQNLDIEFSQAGPQYGGWGILNKFKHPCNTMIVADNYILDDFQKIEKNLLEIFKKLLPVKLAKNDFHITIFTNCKDKNRLKYDIESRYKYLTQQISMIKRSSNRTYNIVLKIIGMPGNKLHDRNILTNYIKINSGHGFSIYKDAKFANSRFSIDFISKNNIFDNLSTLITMYKIVEQNAKNKDDVVMPKNLSGKITTRLLKECII